MKAASAVRRGAPASSAVARLASRALRAGAFVALVPALLGASWASAGDARATAATRAVVDDLGHETLLPGRPRRVVSLAPSLTRTVADLGAADRLVGVSDACDDPPEVRALPSVGTLVQPSLEAIVALEPDLVLASSAGNPRAVVERLRELGVSVHGVAPRSPGLDGIAASVASVGRALGLEPEARRRIDDFERKLARIADSTGERAPESRRACWLVWEEPPTAAGAGTFLSDLLELAGLENACARGEEPWPRLSREELVLRRPDWLVVSRAHSGGAAAGGGWTRALPAVRAGRVVAVEADDFLRPTLGVAEHADELVRRLRE